MFEDSDFHNRMMKLHEENLQREREREAEKQGLWNYNKNRNSSSPNSISIQGMVYLILFGIIGFVIYRISIFVQENKTLVITILLIFALITIFIIIKKIKASLGPSTTIYLGKDSKGRSVFEIKKSNGKRSMLKVMENGKIVIGINNIESDRGKASFKASEHSRRFYLALEKGLVQAMDSKGNIKKNDKGFIIFKDIYGNYIDNPDEYMGFTGEGTETLSNGDVYEGNYVNGVWHGIGKHTQANGCIYEGDFVEGRYHGKGKFTWPDGATYEGDFINGYFHGRGKVTFADGYVAERNFKDGDLDE